MRRLPVPAAPMTRRRATIALHWSVAVLLTVLLADGVQGTGVALAFGLCGAAMCALAAARGAMTPRAMHGML